MSGIIHVVQIQFKSAVSDEVVQTAVNELKSLKSKCIHPTRKTPYIKSVQGGRDNSIEGLQNGYTHMFVTEFENVEDRNYYAKEDPVHLALGSTLPPLVEKLQVLDIAG
ncbi:hypothetical protein DL98DRAFT_563943 [Cadophora sp. DSE1049]|nr:hypothetical protein DL98DRAFT_563943 [Cadophora sp. DSE1049]